MGERKSLRKDRPRVRVDFRLPRLICENGHAFGTAFPASFAGTACEECGSPLRRESSFHITNERGAE